MIVFLVCFLFASANGNTQGFVFWGLSDGTYRSTVDSSSDWLVFVLL